MLLLWTDITYLFPEEPVELYGHLQIDHLPHKLFNTELRKALDERYITWKGSANQLVYEKERPGRCIADMSIGALRANHVFHGNEIREHVNPRISRFRLHGIYQPQITTVTERDRNIWFMIIFKVPGAK